MRRIGRKRARVVRRKFVRKFVRKHRAKKAGPNLAIVRGVRSPFPPRLRTRMRSEANVWYLAANGPLLKNIVKLNSLNVPFTGVTTFGAQYFVNPTAIEPAGLGNLIYNASLNTGIYYRYRVYGAKLQMTVSPGNSADACYGVIAVQNKDDSTFATSISAVQNAMQAPNSTYRICSINNNMGNNVVSYYISTAKAYGVAHTAVRDEDEFTGTFSTDPVNLIDFTTFIDTTDNAGFVGTCSVNFKLTQYVEFYEPATSLLRDI